METNHKLDILEDFEPLIELRAAYERCDKKAFEGILSEICSELADEYRTKIEDKVRRWATATVVLRFYDSAPARAYIQAKMLYRDGFYEATIMVARSIAEMICYDRLDGITHPFGRREEIERKSFRQLIKWLFDNAAQVNQKVFTNLNSLYDLGNNYVHPKAGQQPKEDSLKALHLVGESVFELYGVKSFDEVIIGSTIRSPYSDYPDICSGQNFMLTGFISLGAALEHGRRHYKAKPDNKRDEDSAP